MLPCVGKAPVGAERQGGAAGIHSLRKCRTQCVSPPVDRNASGPLSPRCPPLLPSSPPAAVQVVFDGIVLKDE